MTSYAAYFPMAAASGPVGYAAVGVGAATGAEALPVDNFDVQTVGEAWAALFGGALFPATPPAAGLHWQPAFMGPADEVDAGRSRGRSAHLALLLAVAAWRAERQAAPERPEVRLWATGELDPDGALKPVDGLAHKLRLFLEHWAVHGGRCLLVAPAANRPTLDLAAVAAGRPLIERHFDPRRPLPLPDAAGPMILWVNRGDVRPLLDRLFAQPRRAGRSGRWLAAGLAAAAGLALLLLGPWWPGAGAPTDTGQHWLPRRPAAAIASAPFALALRHDWDIDRRAVAAALAPAEVREQDAAVIWEDDGAAFRPDTVTRCGEVHALPAAVRLRFHLEPQRFWVEALGETSAALSYLYGPVEGPGPRLPRPFIRRNVEHARPVYDPRLSVLFRSLVAAYRRFLHGGAVRQGPDSITALLKGEIFVHNGLNRPIHLVQAAVRCCASLNGCDRGDVRNRVCPLPGVDAAGTFSHSFSLVYRNPQHGYIGLQVNADRGNPIRIELDGSPALRCAGPAGTRGYRIDTFPAAIRLAGQRRWSAVRAEFTAALVADSVRFTDAAQQPTQGLSAGLAPRMLHLDPGWTAAPEVLLAADFRNGRPAPFTAERGRVQVESGRLRLERTVGRFGYASLELNKPVDGAWKLGATMELLSEQSLVSICLANRDWAKMACLSLTTETLNGSRRGAYLFCDTTNDNASTPAERIAIDHRFDPRPATLHRLELERDATGRWSLWVDGTLRGRSTAACLIDGFDRMSLLGGQDSAAGHGGFIDDVVLYRQQHRKSVPPP
jgi:hypothetical protein